MDYDWASSFVATEGLLRAASNLAGERACLAATGKFRRDHRMRWLTVLALRVEHFLGGLVILSLHGTVSRSS